MKSDKSVLVIDTPKSCAVCPIFQNDLDGYCPVALSSPYNKYNERDKHCPLRPLPSQLEENHNLWTNDREEEAFKEGFNRCLELITGETE